MANRFLSNIRINDAYTFPASDGSAGQAIITDGAGNLSFGTVSGGGGGQTSSVVYRENFTGDGTTTDFQLTRTITDENITQVYIDGVYQEKDAYSIVSLDTISFTAAPPNGDSIEVMYFYAIDAIPQPSTSVIYRDNFTGDGTTTAFTLANSIEAEDHTQVYIDGAYQEKDTYTAVGTTLTFATAPASGHSVEVISIAALTRDYSPTTIYQDNFTGDGTTVAFTMQNAVDDEVKTMVYFDGVYQFKGTYTVNGVTITFDAAPASGVNVEVITIASARGFEYNAQTVYFYGKASEAISKGDAIMFAGQQGDHFLFAKATQAAISANHEYFLGLATQDLTTGEFGYVTEFGSVSGLDTTAYTAGDILWFDAGGSTAGALTTTEPAAPLVKIQVAAVIRSHQDEGVLFVRPTWYHELGELHDVNITSVADKDMLVWDNANGYWENSKTLGDITVGTLTATNVGGTLSTAAQPNVTSVGTLSSLAVSGNLTVDTNTLFVNAANNNVGIGTTTAAGANGKGLAIYDADFPRLTFRNSTSGDTTSDGMEMYMAGSNFYHDLGEAGSQLFYTSGTERMRIDSSGRVGIGQAPDRELNLTKLTDNSIMSIKSGSNRLAGIVLGDGDDDDRGAIIYNNTSDYLYFLTAATERIRIDSNGHVGIGHASLGVRLDVNSGATNTVAAFRSTDAGAFIGMADNTTTLDGGIFPTLSVGAIGNNLILNTANAERIRITSNGNVGIGTSSPTDYSAFGYRTLEVSGSSINRTGALILSDSAGTIGGTLIANEVTGLELVQPLNRPLLFYTNNTEKVRILPTGGITFNGDTAAANALDDYEEGTWTPTLLAGGVEPSGISYSVRSGTYVKIGKKVTLWVSIKVNSKGTGSGQVEIGGLPFTVANIAAYKHPMGTGTVLKNNTEVYVSLCAPTRIFFRRLTSTGDTPLDFSELDNATFILQTITHEV